MQASFLKKTLTVEGSRVHLNIWDTAGQERFHALGPIYYRDSNGAILVYDVTDPDSLSKVKTWVKELKKMLGATVCLAIVGNKIDLLTGSERSDPTTNALVKEGLDYAASLSKRNSSGGSFDNPSTLTLSSSSGMNAVHYLTSAKQDKGIDETFLDLTRRMLKYYQETHPVTLSSSSNNLHAMSSNRILRVADEEEEEQTNRTSTRKCNC